MMNIEVNDVRTANLVKEAIDTKVIETKSLLHTEVSKSDDTIAGIGSMDMTTITELVTDINTLSEVSNLITLKMQFLQTSPTE